MDLGAPPPGWKQIDFKHHRKAATLDDIYAAVKEKRLVAADNVKALLSDEKLKNAFGQHIEQFNFGSLENATINEAAKEAFDFIEHGLFTLPYPMCFYRFTVLPHGNSPDPVGLTLLLIADDYEDPTSPFSVVEFMHGESGHIVAIHSMTTRTVKMINGERSCELRVPKREVEFWKDKIKSEDGGSLQLVQMADGALLALGLTMILNTKGVRKERTAPPAKPNKRRAAAGRPLLPWVTHVYTNVYRQAVQPGTGTHASPRPHRRRAHVRIYRHEDGSVKLAKPIAAMLVNWDGQPLERGAYDVETDHAPT